MAKTVSEEKKKRSLSSKGSFNLTSFIIKAAVCILASFITASAFFSSTNVQDESMSPTLENGQTVFIDRFRYKLASVRRGDVIAYRSRDDAGGSIHISRVIGLPGETVEIRDGLILIDGKTYIESGSFPAITVAGIAEEPLTLSSSEYFILGDNRNDSRDSRFADIGNITSGSIIGKVWFTFSPGSSSGFVK